MSVRVVTAAEAAARDRAAIDAGVPSRALMRAAGMAAAGEIVRRFPEAARRGIGIFAGPGNNGGDAWVVAGALAAAGHRVRVMDVVDAKTDDARAEREAARPLVRLEMPDASDGVIVDGMLGTGATGAPRGEIADAVARVRALRDAGAIVVALDLPTGVDADTGRAESAVTADLTVTFGAVKRGHLVARAHCGRIAVVDIGLGAHASIDDGAPLLVDRRWTMARVPPIAADAHKGSRGKLAIVGGGIGMAGATLLAARAAMRSGIGMVRLLVAPEAVPVVQAAEPTALARPWPTTEDELRRDIIEWADGVLIGPGLGTGGRARGLVERVLRSWRGPTVVDADALNVFAGEAGELGIQIGERPAIVTPHAAELGRLTGAPVDDVLAKRFDAGGELALRLHATVLLKGVPTVITTPEGARIVSAAGTPALAAAGSGDLLAGIVATLLTQTSDPLGAAGAGAWLHGRAAELATEGRALRGIALPDVLDALPRVWEEPDSPPVYPTLAELSSVGDPARAP